MEDTHLLNSIRYLERLKEREERRMLAGGSLLNGEAARDAFETEFDEFMDSDVGEIYPVYNTMCAEAAKRGLHQRLWCTRCQQFHDAEAACKTIFCKACQRNHPPAVNRFHRKALGCKSWLQNFVPIIGVK